MKNLTKTQSQKDIKKAKKQLNQCKDLILILDIIEYLFDEDIRFSDQANKASTDRLSLFLTCKWIGKHTSNKSIKKYSKNPIAVRILRKIKWYADECLIEHELMSL